MTSHILVVEDDPDQAMVLRMRLEAEDYAVLTVANGADAMQLVESGICDLVLVDVNLPDIHGFDLCRRIREWELATEGHSPVMPIVMVTGSVGEARAAALEAGADDFLAKPINHVELLARVRNLLRIKQLHDELEARNHLLFDALQRHVSAAVAQNIVDDPERYLRPGGERRVVTVLFADLRGYSTLAEEMPPQDVIVVLNAYLGLMIDAIHRHGGTVNQILGDGIMSIFGAPVCYGDDAYRAVRAAVEMQRDTVALEPPQCHGIRLPLGIGITTGDAVVGHIGSEHRIDYTAVGAVTNLAARLVANAGPGQILITAPTYEQVRDWVVVGDVGTQSVRGHLEWVQAYSVLGMREGAPAPAVEVSVS